MWGKERFDMKKYKILMILTFSLVIIMYAVMGF